MRKKLILISVLVLLMLLAAAPTILVVEATKPLPVNGTYFPIGAPTLSNSRDAGKSDNGFVDISMPIKWVGSIMGTGVEKMHWIMLREGTSEEKTIIHAVITLTSVKIFNAAKTGTLTIDFYNVVVGEEGTGLWRIVDGTDQLASLHGEGKLDMISPLPNVVVAYSGQVHFDP